jgi:carnosine N-methyltransferase
MREPITGALSMEELQREEHHHDHSLKNAEIRLNNKTCEFDGGHLNHDHGSVPFSSHDWLDSSLQAHVPLVDVNKVRWVIRNIVRDWGAEVIIFLFVMMARMRSFL